MVRKRPIDIQILIFVFASLLTLTPVSHHLASSGACKRLPIKMQHLIIILQQVANQRRCFIRSL